MPVLDGEGGLLAMWPPAALPLLQVKAKVGEAALAESLGPPDLE